MLLSRASPIFNPPMFCQVSFSPPPDLPVCATHFPELAQQDHNEFLHLISYMSKSPKPVLSRQLIDFRQRYTRKFSGERCLFKKECQSNRISVCRKGTQTHTLHFTCELMFILDLSYYKTPIYKTCRRKYRRKYLCSWISQYFFRHDH